MNTHKARQDLIHVLEVRLWQRMSEHHLGGLVYARKQALEQLFTAKEAAKKLGIGLRTFYGFSRFLSTPNETQRYASKHVYSHVGLQKIIDLMDKKTCKGEDRQKRFNTKNMPTKEMRRYGRRERTSQNGPRASR